MFFWKRCARKSGKEKFRSDTIRVAIDVGKALVGATEDKRLRWFGHVMRIPGNRLSRRILE